MGSTSQPGPGVYVGAVCMVEAPESQGRNQQDLGCTIPYPSYPPQQYKGSLHLKQIALIQRTLLKNALILCVNDKS